MSLSGKLTWVAVVVTVASVLTGSLYLFFPCVELSTEDAGVVGLYPVDEGETVILSHVNSIYDSPVQEILAVRDGVFELEEVKTTSYGVKEYYGIAEGIHRRSWKEIRFRNSADRGFSLRIGTRLVKEVGMHRNKTITLRLRRFYPVRHLLSGFH